MTRAFTTATVGFLALFLFGAATPAFADSEWVEYILDVGAEYSSRSNINNAFLGWEEANDSIITASASVGRVFQASDFTRISATFDISNESYNDYNDLTNLYAGLSISIRHKLGLGLMVPWIRASATTAKIDYCCNDIRDRTLYTIGVQAGKRISDRLNLWISYLHDNQDGDAEPATFDLSGNTGAINGDYLLTDRLLLGMRFAHRTGGVNSMCSADNYSYVETAAEDVQKDSVFGDYCVYRLDATSNTFGADLSYTFMDGHLAINLAYERTDADADMVTYKSDIFRSGVYYSF